jgi:hypothetical protein
MENRAIEVIILYSQTTLNVLLNNFPGLTHEIYEATVEITVSYFHIYRVEKM